ncbi:MAG: hypothetical protein HY795_01740 [Desulfovibrio sp.]|nr:hypothetical protein [Desulfovibrio sp.]MBI4960020.1 hypothetical protein [Desulfovibrio sp.]
MRIRGRGSSSFGSGGQHRESERSERFRKAHRVGQKVSGTIQQWDESGLAWVQIDGHRLLAQVSQDSNLGLERAFLVVSLSPDIVLKEITGKHSGLNVLV